MSPLRVALVAGEHSGDQLGFKLMWALSEAQSGDVAFLGVGGEAMEAEGLKSLFPISDIAVMGILPVLARLPTLLAAYPRRPPRRLSPRDLTPSLSSTAPTSPTELPAACGRRCRSCRS